jgi:hypothetical protein
LASNECRHIAKAGTLGATESVTMNVNRHYKQAVLYPFIVVILFTIVFSIVDNYNYKSEWLTADSVIMLSIIWAFLYSLVIGIFSLTILLNKIERIRTSILLVVLSWFLLPFSFIAVVISHEINFKMKYEAGKFGSDFIYILILNLPFVIGLIWSYVRYTRTSSR